MGLTDSPGKLSIPTGFPQSDSLWEASRLNPKMSSGFERPSSICQQGFVVGALLFLLETVSSAAEDGWRLEKPSCSLQKSA